MLGNYPNRQEFSRPFRAVQNGNSEVLPDFIPSGLSSRYHLNFALTLLPVGKKYDLPAEMQILFERDRQKKAEKKRLREQARLEAAADPFAKHRGGKKSRKATLRAARMDPNITVIPTRIYDMATLVSKIRSYIANPQVTHNMILPPMEKSERARVHELALAFNLASKSKGDGGIRFITLSKTRYSGTKINEQKVKRLLAESKMSFGGVPVRAKKSNTTLPKNRDGDIVGKVRALSSCNLLRPKFFTGGAESRSVQPWFQDVSHDGMVGRGTNWVWWSRCAFGSCHQEHEAWSWGNKMMKSRRHSSL